MSERLAYIRAGWLPTRQANGIQTVRMCEAFAKAGWTVTLYYIPSPIFKEDIFRYYDVKTPFTLRILPRAILPIRKSFEWAGLRRLPQYIHAFLWAWLVVKIARNQGADLYFTREPMIAWWLSRLNLPTILEVHNYPSAYLDRLVLLKASSHDSVKLIISITEHLRRDLISLGISGTKTIVLHDGVDIERYNNCRISKKEARHTLGLPLDKDLIIYTGQLYPEKGIDTLVKAGALIPEVLIVVVGGQIADIERLQKLAQLSGTNNIIFKGYVPPTVALLYQKAGDILVIPQSAQSNWSAYYMSPLKLFEYMASGRPIVATRVPCLMEILEHGRNAWLVEPDDVYSLAEGIKFLLMNKQVCEQLVKGALSTIQKFTWENRVSSIEKELQKLGVLFYA